MSRPTRVALSLGAAALTLSLAACSSSGGGSTTTTSVTTAAGSSTSTSSTPTGSTSSTSSTDYASLLIDASDIPIAGFEKGTPATPPGGTGTTVAFTGAGGRTLGDTVLVLSDAATAQAAAAASVDSAKSSVSDAEVTTAPIGDGGTAIRGTNAGGAAAVLIFSQGRAVVVLEFDSDASDPVPTDVIQAVATAQAAKITSGLPG